jgi:hypothetical protein
MSLVGADISALRGFGYSAARRRRDIEATRQRLTLAIEALDWSGPDRDRFLDEWRRFHLPGLMSLEQDIGDVARSAFHQANVQEQASLRWH